VKPVPNDERKTMKLAAKPMGSIAAVKASLTAKGNADNGEIWIKNIPADGLNVRFLSEPDGWFGYSEYFDPAAKLFIPMVEGEILPNGTKPSFRYLVNAVDLVNDRVIPLKLPKQAASSLFNRYDKYQTLLDRPYELMRYGEGLNTTYEVVPEAPSPFNAAKYELHDLGEILLAARIRALGDEDAPVTEPGQPAPSLEQMTLRDLRAQAVALGIDPNAKDRESLIAEIVEAGEA
jgi:hypothetical protein